MFPKLRSLPCALVLVALFTDFASQLLARELAKVEALPAGTFGIEDVLEHFGYVSFQVHRFAIRGARMFFLISHGPTIEEAALLSTDLYGGTPSIHSLGRQELYDLAISPDGMSYATLFADDHNVAVVEVFSVEGLLIRKVSLKGNPTRLGYLQDQYVAIDPRGRVTRLNGDQSEELRNSLLGNSSGLKEVVSFPGNRMAIVNRTSADIEIVNVTSGSRSRPVLDEATISRERARIVKTYAGGASPENVLLGVTADPDGSMYLLPAGFNPLRDPAPVLVVDSQGVEQKVLLCRLPPIENGSQMIPIGIAASSSELAFVDEHGRVALFYFNSAE